MRLAILLFCSAVVFGQSAAPPSAPKARGKIEILSDTQGVDFGPYLQRILQNVRQNWLKRIPESTKSKKGNVAIEFAIAKDGKLRDMRIVDSSADFTLAPPGMGQY